MDIVLSFNESKFYLGTLCKRGHKYKGIDKSLRDKRKSTCVECKGTKNPGFRSRSVEQRFWEKVRLSGHEDGCWIWMSWRDVNGYGRFNLSKKKRASLAHRYAFEYVNGHLSDDLNLLHICDNPSCVNPFHLRPGTHLDNMRDMQAKGRRASFQGEKSGLALLTEKQVREIRFLHSSGQKSYKALALQFRVSKSAISEIVTRKTWKHIP